MKIGLLLPSVLMSKKYQDRIFAQRDLFLWLSEGLIKKGHEVFIYTADGTGLSGHIISGDKRLEAENLYSIKDKPGNLKEKLSFIRTAYEYELELASKAFSHANKNDLDVLHVYLGYLSDYFTSFSKAPVVFTLHDPVFPGDTLEYLRYTLFRDLNYISISDSQKSNYDKYMGIKTLGTVYHGLKIEDFVFSEAAGDYLSFMGRYLPEKGVSDAIQTALLVKKPIKLASSKNYQGIPYYEEKIKPFLSSGYVEEVSYLSTPQEKSRFFKNSKALLFSVQWEEPFGMAMIESMVCGSPVIAYAQGSVPEIIKDGETGFIVNLSEADKRGEWVIKKTGIKGLAEAVEKIYSMPEEEYKGMRLNCRKHVEENFTVGKMVEGHERVYQKIASQGVALRG